MRTMLACAVVAVGLCGAVQAGTLEGVTMPDQQSAGSRTLTLNGMGLRQATMLKVKVYVAGLYVEAKSSDPGEILKIDRAKRLDLKFVRAVGRKDLVKAWNEGFEKNAGKDADALKDRIATFNGFMEDMPDGGTMTFTFVPGTGVTVDVQGKTKGTIKGDDFGTALFKIWLGDSPPNPGLKEGLLGGKS